MPPEQVHDHQQEDKHQGNPQGHGDHFIGVGFRLLADQVEDGACNTGQRTDDKAHQQILLSVRKILRASVVDHIIGQGLPRDKQYQHQNKSIPNHITAIFRISLTSSRRFKCTNIRKNKHQTKIGAGCRRLQRSRDANTAAVGYRRTGSCHAETTAGCGASPLPRMG